MTLEADDHASRRYELRSRKPRADPVNFETAEVTEEVVEEEVYEEEEFYVKQRRSAAPRTHPRTKAFDHATNTVSPALQGGSGTVDSLKQQQKKQAGTNISQSGADSEGSAPIHRKTKTDLESSGKATLSEPSSSAPTISTKPPTRSCTVTVVLLLLVGVAAVILAASTHAGRINQGSLDPAASSTAFMFLREECNMYAEPQTCARITHTRTHSTPGSSPPSAARCWRLRLTSGSVIRIISHIYSYPITLSSVGRGPWAVSCCCAVGLA